MQVSLYLEEPLTEQNTNEQIIDFLNLPLLKSAVRAETKDPK